MEHAGYMVRFGALMIDGFIAMFVVGILNGVFMVRSDSGGFMLLYNVAVWLYFTLFECTVQATPGKMILGLKVVGANAPKITFGQANIRYWAKPIFLVWLWLRLVYCRLTGNKQMAVQIILEERPFLHDQWAKTLVLKK